MSKAKARVFVPLTKVDEEKRLVYGTITQEILDKAGEVMDYDTSKPLFEKWSNDIHEASGGLSKGNLRVMHGLNVAGKLTDINFDDDSKAIDVCSKVVDDAEWNKVLEGCYTGFSVGGSYAKRWTETVDGAKVKKFTAQPNEVSLVDNPCVPSATFTMVKADGAEEAIEFKVENDDEAWPDFAKADTGEEAAPATETPVTPAEPTNDQVVAKAGEMAKAANDGTTWMDHVVGARDALMKGDTLLGIAAQQAKDAKAAENEGAKEEAAKEGDANEGAEASTADADAATDDAAKATPAGVMQKWTTSDGKAFEKKADAVAHENTLNPPAELTEAEKLQARLGKALAEDAPEPEPGLWEDYDRLSKAVQALATPFDDAGQPKLEKGMYTVNRFSNVLSDMAALSRTIKAEAGKGDGTISADIIGAVKTLGDSFIAYAKDQVTDLLAGMDDDVAVCYHDYYYRAAQDDTENGLAKDVTSLVEEFREPASDRREELAKAFGITDAPVEDDAELSPPLQKRFDALESENAELKKVAEQAVGAVEELSKRMKAIEDKPEPRAPRNVISREGDGTFLGKAVTTEADKIAVVKDMLETHGPDAMATMMIKAAHAQGGHVLQLKS